MQCSLLHCYRPFRDEPIASSTQSCAHRDELKHSLHPHTIDSPDASPKASKGESRKRKRVSSTGRRKTPETLRNVTSQGDSGPSNAVQRQPKGTISRRTTNSPIGSEPRTPAKHRARKPKLSDTAPRRSPRNHMIPKHIDPGGDQTNS